MGLAKEQASIHEEVAEICESMDDELLSEWGPEEPEDLDQIPTQQYLELKMRLLGKRCPRGLVHVLAGAALFAAFLGCIGLVTFSLRQSTKIPSMRSPPFEPPVLGGEPARRSTPAPPPQTFTNQASPSYSPIQQPPTPTPAAARPATAVCDIRRTAYCPARALFRSPEVHRVLTNSLMRTSNQLLMQADYEIISDLVAMGLRKIDEEVIIRSPSLANELKEVQLQREQSHAILDVLSLLSDPSVQGLGFNVAKIMRSSPFATQRYVRFHIEDMLEPIDEIRKQAHSLIPGAMVALWARGGHEWEMTLDPKNIRFMRMDHKGPQLDRVGLDFKTKSLFIYAGVLQTGRVLLDLMKAHVRAASWSTNADDTVAPLFEGIAQPADSSKQALVEMSLWPLKCAAQGLDALRASLDPNFGHGHKPAGEGGPTPPPSTQRPYGHRINHGMQSLDALRAEFKR